jgi:starch synthase
MAIAAGQGTGFHFSPVSAEMLRATIPRVMRAWRDRALWRRLQANALATDVSWSRSAARYAALYRAMVADAG